MQAIPLPPTPQLDAVTAYSLAGGSVVVGLVVAFFGRRLHYLFAAGIGACVGFALIPMVQGHLEVKPIYLNIGVVLAAAVVLALIARVTWALAAGAVGAAVAGTILLLNRSPQIPQEASESLIAWWQSVAPVVFDVELIKRVWEHEQGRVLLVVFPATALPLLVGVFFNRAVIILMTALIGAALSAAGLIVGMAQIKPQLWPQKWMDVVVLALGGAVIMLVGAICQCLIRPGRKEPDSQQKD